MSKNKIILEYDNHEFKTSFLLSSSKSTKKLMVAQEKITQLAQDYIKVSKKKKFTIDYDIDSNQWIIS